jgi:hypothetical protein
MKCAVCGDELSQSPYEPFEWYHSEGNENYDHKPMNSGQPASGSKFGQMMVDQRPRFDNQRKTVYSRKLKVHRPTLKRKKVKYL